MEAESQMNGIVFASNQSWKAMSTHKSCSLVMLLAAQGSIDLPLEKLFKSTRST